MRCTALISPRHRARFHVSASGERGKIFRTASTPAGRRPITVALRAGASTFLLGAVLPFAAQAQIDTTPPTVAITSPAPGAAVCGTIPVMASASDDVGVVGFSDGKSSPQRESFFAHDLDRLKSLICQQLKPSPAFQTQRG